MARIHRRERKRRAIPKSSDEYLESLFAHMTLDSIDTNGDVTSSIANAAWVEDRPLRRSARLAAQKRHKYVYMGKELSGRQSNMNGNSYEDHKQTHRISTEIAISKNLSELRELVEHYLPNSESPSSWAEKLSSRLHRMQQAIISGQELTETRLLAFALALEYQAAKNTEQTFPLDASSALFRRLDLKKDLFNLMDGARPDILKIGLVRYMDILSKRASNDDPLELNAIIAYKQKRLDLVELRKQSLLVHFLA